MEHALTHRPGGDADLLDWLRQCRRAGLYEQGKAISEKGGLNLANLTDEQQIEAEDDYRICVRRGIEHKRPNRRSVAQNPTRRRRIGGTRHDQNDPRQDPRQDHRAR